ncbi:MAG: hypothetical protein ACRDTJ_31705 [Pseudonocardiaceae bacterium]
MSAQLTLDELDFLPAGIVSALANPGYYFEATADGTEWGNAPAIVSSVTSELFEGAAVEITGYESLPATVTVRVVGIDMAAVATGAAELVKVCRREAMKALTYAPSDGTAPPTVFDVLAVTWESPLDDMDERRNLPRRTYELTLHCKPFPRSADLVTIPAVEIASTAPTITSIDAGSSTTGWSTTAKAVSRINLVTNGRFAFGIQGWYRGRNAARITWEESNWLRVYGSTRDDRCYVNYGSAPSPVVAGQSYRINMDLGQTTGVTELGFMWRWFRSNGSQIGSDNALTATLGPLGTKSWRTISTTRTAPSGATGLWIFPYGILGQPPGTETYFNVNNVHIELESTWTGSIFDGDTAPSGTTDYVWSGAVGRSVSYTLTPTTPTTSGGKIIVSAYGGHPLSATRTGTIDMTSADYLRLRGTWGGPLTLNVAVDGGGFVPAISPQVAIRSGSTFDAYFPITVDSITGLTLSTNAGSASAVTATLEVDHVDTSTGLPPTGTGRSGDFIADAHGTMPAEASITIGNEADLGRLVLLYTRPASLATVHPALRSRRISGPSVTAAGTNISGFSEVLATSQGSAVTWEIDAVDLPVSAYILAARLTAAGLTSGNGYTLHWRAYMVLDGTTETSVYTGSRTVKATATTYGNAYSQRVTELGLLGLPTMNVFTSGDASAKVRLQMWVTGGGTWSLDESWIFDADKGDLTIVEPVSPLHRLKVTPASADRPVQTYIAEYEPSMGTITARDVHLDVQSWSSHKVDPRDGEVAIYVATLTGTPTLSAEVEYYPRWDVYAAPIEVDIGEATA